MATRVFSDTGTIVDMDGAYSVSLAWSTDSRFLFIGTKENGLATYDVRAGKRLAFAGNNSQVQALAASPDGKLLAAGLGSDGSIRLISITTGELLTTIWPAHDNWVQALSFSPGSDRLASGGDDGAIKLWNVDTGELDRVVYENGDWVWGLSYSPDGRRLVAGFQTEYTFRVWNTGSWDLIGEWAGDQAADLAFSPDGRTFVTAGGGIHEANLWDSASGRQLFNLREAPGWVYAVAYDPRGEYVVSGGIGEVVIMWSVKTGQPVRELYTGPDFVQALAYSPDGSMLASAGSQVIIWNVESP